MFVMEDSLTDVADIFVLFLHSAHLALKSSILAVLDLNEVDVTLKYTEIFNGLNITSSFLHLDEVWGALNWVNTYWHCLG